MRRSALGILVILLLTPVLFASSARAEEGWKIEKNSVDNLVIASVHGVIVWGNRLRVIFFPGHCERAQLVFNMRTYNEGLERHKGRAIRIEMTGREYPAKLLGVTPFPPGGLSMLSVGVFWVDDLLTWADWTRFRGHESFYVKILDGNGYRVGDLFDIPEERWPFDGYTRTLTEAQKRCRAREKAEKELSLR